MRHRFPASRWRSLLLLLALGVAVGCQSNGQQAIPSQRQIIAVFADEQRTDPVTGASTRGYRGRSGWPVSLHTLARVRRVAEDHDLRELEAWPVPALQIYCVVMAVPEHASRDALIRRLNADARIELAQPVHQYRLLLGQPYDDPLFDVQFGKHRPALESVHTMTRGGGVRIAIIDGEVDTSHPDLRGQVRRHAASPRSVDLSMLMHGTAVAGVVAAMPGNGEGLVGLAPDAEVTAYGACRHRHGSQVRCTSVSLALAIERATEDGADVINLSLTGPADWLLERLLEHAHERGAVLVAATDGGTTQSFPASLPYVHAAGELATPWFAQSTRFSTRAGGGYQVFTGASMSAAGATGAAALLLSERSVADARIGLDALLDPDCQAPRPDDSEGDRLLAALSADAACSR